MREKTACLFTTGDEERRLPGGGGWGGEGGGRHRGIKPENMQRQGISSVLLACARAAVGAGSGPGKAQMFAAAAPERPLQLRQGPKPMVA